MSVIDGKTVAKQVKDEVKEKAELFEKKYGRKITLAVVMAGNDPASSVYVKNKIKAAEYVGIKSLSFLLPENVSQKQAEETVSSLAKDDTVDGILVQLPLPKGLDEYAITDLIPAEKDVDGFTAENVGKLLLGKPCVVSCTPKGVITLLKSVNVTLSGKNAVVIGRSNIVGKPMSALLLAENCTVTTCHSKTSNLKEICKNADIIVAAIGKPDFVKGDMVKNGAIVIDVGINRTEKGLVGDVCFDEVKDKAEYVTPVPGGVGPMTIASLMQNVCECAYVRMENKNA